MSLLIIQTSQSAVILISADDRDLTHWVDQGVHDPTISHINCRAPMVASSFLAFLEELHHGRAFHSDEFLISLCRIFQHLI